MNRETRLARQRLEPSRINGEVGPTAWATSSQHEWTPGQSPHDRFTFSLRIKPDRRRVAMPVDSASERRRR
ncbi:MAG: hypothetical protein ABW292_18980 [Vicinamibacterales bacterium]|jgi:hypothetical protein